MKTSIFDTTAVELFFKEHKIPPFRLKQLYHEIYKLSVIDFEEMVVLPKEVRWLLSEHFEIISLIPDQVLDSRESTKIGFQMTDGNIIESVVMYHYHGFDGERPHLNRITLCISTQVGCPVGCIFCVTGKLWFSKNLEYAHIMSQIIWINHYVKNRFGKREDGEWRKVRNIVFMGMGEPLLNYEHMKSSIICMLDQQRLGLSKRHVTISTSGIIPGIERLISDWIDVRLALSLHAPNQQLREQLIPTISKVYTLEKLMAVIDRYVEATNNRIFYEYIMIKDLTDTLPVAHQLVTLLQGRLGHINLIPYNPNPAMPDLEESSMSQIYRFRNVLEEGGLTVTVRDNHGRDLKGACGQLGYEKVKNGEVVIKTKRNIEE